MKQMAHGSVSVDMGVQSGKKTAPAGDADRILAKSIGKRDPFPGCKFV